MKAGKIPPQDLESLVLRYSGFKRQDVFVSAGIGEDAAVIGFGDEVCVVSSDPITGAAGEMGRLAVHVACNDIAAAGARPIAIQVVLLLPERITARQLEKIMHDVHTACLELQIEIGGGHTEILSNVKEPIIVITAMGRAPRKRYVTTAGARPGNDIVVTKGIGLEGTAILATDFASRLDRCARDVLEAARGFIEEISVVPEGLIAADMGATAMHDITEGGLYGALWELSTAADVGFEVEYDRVPIRRETMVVCRELGINPLALISSGSMLICIDRGDRLVKRLGDEGIRAECVGRIKERDRLVRMPDGQVISIDVPPEDELWRFLSDMDT